MYIDIPTWLSVPLCLLLPWLAGAMWYVAGKYSERRRLRPVTSPRTSYDITISFAGKREEHPDFEAQLVKVLEDLRDKEATRAPKGDAS